MASARIVHYWPDDDGSTWFEVEPDPSRLDGIDEACRQVTRMWREVCGDMVADADVVLSEYDADEASE